MSAIKYERRLAVDKVIAITSDLLYWPTLYVTALDLFRPYIRCTERVSVISNTADCLMNTSIVLQYICVGL